MLYTYIYIYIYIYPPPCPWHEVGVFGHRAKRVRRCQYPTINDVNDLRSMLSMMDWSTIVFRAARSSGHLHVNPPLTTLKSLFRLPTSASKLDSFSKPQNPPKIVQKAPKTVPKTLPKRLSKKQLMFQRPKCSKIIPLWYENRIFAFAKPSKSFQNRCQNSFKICFMLDTRLEP